MRMHKINNKEVINVALMRTPILNPVGPFSNPFNMIVLTIPPSVAPEVTMVIVVVWRRLE